jgi:hypothetical protein
MWFDVIGTLTPRGNNNFRINCERQDSNSRPWALIPCRTACSSQCDQKTDLMEEIRQYIYTSTLPSRVASSGLNVDQKWAAISLFNTAPARS